MDRAVNASKDTTRQKAQRSLLERLAQTDLLGLYRRATTSTAGYRFTGEGGCNRQILFHATPPFPSYIPSFFNTFKKLPFPFRS